MSRRTLLGDLREQQRVLAHALNWFQQVTAQIHSVVQLQLLRLKNSRLTILAQCCKNSNTNSGIQCQAN